MIGGVKVKDSLTDANVDPKNVQHTKVGEEMVGWLQKFQDIEKKNRCLRVRFLDWLSDKLLNWSNRLHVMSANIDSPCVLEVAPRKKEDSQHAKESKKIQELRESLAQAYARQDKLKEENLKLSKELVKDLEKKIAEMA